jgi:hypothetical protein
MKTNNVLDYFPYPSVNGSTRGLKSVAESRKVRFIHYGIKRLYNTACPINSGLFRRHHFSITSSTGFDTANRLFFDLPVTTI